MSFKFGPRPLSDDEASLLKQANYYLHHARLIRGERIAALLDRASIIWQRLGHTPFNSQLLRGCIAFAAEARQA